MSPRVRKRIGTWMMGISLAMMAYVVYRGSQTGQLVSTLVVTVGMLAVFHLTTIKASRERQSSVSKNDHPSPTPRNHTP